MSHEEKENAHACRKTAFDPLQTLPSTNSPLKLYHACAKTPPLEYKLYGWSHNMFLSFTLLIIFRKITTHLHVFGLNIVTGQRFRPDPRRIGALSFFCRFPNSLVLIQQTVLHACSNASFAATAFGRRCDIFAACVTSYTFSSITTAVAVATAELRLHFLLILPMALKFPHLRIGKITFMYGNWLNKVTAATTMTSVVDFPRTTA